MYFKGFRRQIVMKKLKSSIWIVIVSLLGSVRAVNAQSVADAIPPVPDIQLDVWNTITGYSQAATNALAGQSTEFTLNTPQGLFNVNMNVNGQGIVQTTVFGEDGTPMKSVEKTEFYTELINQWGIGNGSLPQDFMRQQINGFASTTDPNNGVSMGYMSGGANITDNVLGFSMLGGATTYATNGSEATIFLNHVINYQGTGGNITLPKN